MNHQTTLAPYAGVSVRSSRRSAVLAASSTLHPQPIPLCCGQVVSALGTSLPFPAWPRVLTSIEPTP